MTTTAASELRPDRASLSRETLLRMAAIAIATLAVIGASWRPALAFAYCLTPPAYALAAIGFVTLHPRLRGNETARRALFAASSVLLLAMAILATAPWAGYGIIAAIVAVLSPAFCLVSLTGSLFTEVQNGPSRGPETPPPTATGWRRAFLVLGCAFACFAANGISVVLALLIVPMVVLSALPAIHNCHGAAARLVVATLIGFAAAWFFVATNEIRIDWSDTTAALQWQATYSATDEHYKTLMVTGFPIHGIEGHGGGGAREYLPFEKGLGVLLANFALCVVGAGLLDLLFGRDRHSGAIGLAAGLALVAGIFGGWHLLVMLD